MARSLSSDETNGLDTDSTKVAGEADLVLHGFILVDRSTIRAVEGWFARINGSKGLAVDLKCLTVVVVESVLITRHLFTLLQHLCGLVAEVGVTITVHIGQLQQTACDTGGQDKVLNTREGWE